MHRKNIIRFSLIAVFLLGSFLLLHGTGRVNKEPECRETLKCKQPGNRAGGSEGMIWENLSSSFFSISTSY